MPAGLAVDRASGDVYAALPFGPLVRRVGADRPRFLIGWGVLLTRTP
jgi:hypothetical protein